MKREVIFLCVFLLFALTPLVVADEQSQVDNAYNCLQNKINDTGCEALSLEERIFSLMSVQECRDEVAVENLTTIDSNSTLECWPSQSCNLKTTSQALLGLSEVNYDTTAGEDWLLSKKITATGIDWFLEIESPEATQCEAAYQVAGQHNSYDFSIGADKKISSGAGPCLSIAGGSYDSYFLKVDPSCYNIDLDLTCDKSFISTLLFKKQDSSSSPLNVLETVHGASPGGLTTEKVVSYCFADSSGNCDYEGSLWAAQTLYYLNSENTNYLQNQVSPFLPYLISFSEDNQNYIPESFLYYLTGSFRSDLLIKQIASSYWLGQTTNDKHYDTALALLPFQGESPLEKTNSKNWLLKYQDESGCWNNDNLRDTAFLLYSIWPRNTINPPVPPSNECSTDFDCEDNEECISGNCILPSNGTTIECSTDFDCKTGEECISGFCAETSPSCLDSGYYCLSPIDCDGNFLPTYTCSGISKCCDTPVSLGTCSSQGGEICDSGEKCQGGLTSSADDLFSGETCCISGGECVTSGSGSGSEALCSSNGGSCRISCLDGESSSSFYDCEFSGDVCCFEDGKTTKNRWVIWVLIILILLTVLGIVFREKVKMFFMKMKSRKGKKNGPPSRPTFGGLRHAPPRHPLPSKPIPRRIVPHKPVYTGLKKPETPSKKKPFKYRKELDEVLGKLKEIGKDEKKK